MSLGKFSVTNPVLINILWVAIFALGIFSFIKLPRELFSDTSFSWVFVVVPYPGVGAEEIEKNITIKIEDELSDISEIKKISSVSREGVSFVQIEFDDGISKEQFKSLYQDVRTEFDKVKLPSGTLDPIVDDFSTSDFMPILSVIVSGTIDNEILNKKAVELHDQLKNIPSISNIEILGNQKREVWIEANKEKLDAFGISLNAIADALNYRNTNIPGGTIKTRSREYLIQTLGELTSVEDFGKVIVRRRMGQGSIKVSDVAKINRGLGESLYDARINGKKSILLEITKQLDASSISTVNECKKVVDEFRKNLPKQMRIDFFNDSTFSLRESLGTLGYNAIAGFIFLVIVLCIFLGFRNAFLTAMAIPITFAMTFIFMEQYSETLNGNTLFALVLVLGMIVDHAIVIIENCHRHRQNGMSRFDAAIIGTNEVIKPVLAGTLTTIGAFLPLMLLPGIMGKFMRAIPVVVSFALVASTAEALIFLPVHFADWGGSIKDGSKGFFNRLKSKFSQLIGKIFNYRYLAIILTFVIMILALFTYPYIKLDLFVGESSTYFFVNIKMPNGTTRLLTDEVTRRFEERIISLIGNGEITAINTTVGYLLTDTDRLNQNNVAQIIVDVAEKKDGRIRKIKEIMKDIEQLCCDIPGADQVTYQLLNNGPPVDKPISFRLQGDNLTEMASLSDEYKKMLNKYSELYNISDTYESGMPELRISINEERAAELGLNTALIGSYLRQCYDGITATSFFDNDEEIDVIVRFSENDRASINTILNMKFPTMDGRMIPFSTVCSLEHGTGIFSINHVDGHREIVISADIYSENKKDIINVVTKQIQNEYDEKFKQAYPGVLLKIGGEFAEFGKVISNMIRLLWIGLFFIYIILGSQFKSYMQPFIILLTVPFAFVGCILYLFFSGTAISLVVLYAVVALVGISVNDSIVLISFINSLRKKGVSIGDAIIRGTTTRLRPILLTSITTIGGLMPMAIGIGGKSETWAPMASTIIFGLFFSTAGTLLIIPCAYGILNDFQEKFGIKMKLEGE